MKRPRSVARDSGKAPSRRDGSELVAGGDAIVRLTDSARRGDLVVIVGTGVSMLLTNEQMEHDGS